MNRRLDDTARSSVLGIVLACSALFAGEVRAQVPALPDGARSHWVVGQPHEIVSYLVFDPATVGRRLPKALRFITVEELSAGGVRWARDHMAAHPAHALWGISFLEIIQAGTFMIDGRTPNWPEGGAAALWFARVAPSVTTADPGPGRPFLALEFWIPDRSYVAYMREKGYPATYGQVRLRQATDRTWQGSIDIPGLSLTAECRPTGPVTGGASSAGMQVIFPPRSSTVKGTVRLAFAGHREQECDGDSSWTLRGSHPLVGGLFLPPSTYQFGYDLKGGTYP